MRQSTKVLLHVTVFLTGLAVGHTGTPDPSFSCSDQFGSYPDPTDCTKYYVCVFGDALHETCIGGLYFNTRLQTCDWPINTNCGVGSQTSDENYENFPNNGDFFSSVRRKQGSSPGRSSSYNYRSKFRNKGEVNERSELRLSISSTSPPPPDFPLTTPLKSPYQKKHERVNPGSQREVNHGVYLNSHNQGSQLQYEEGTHKTETPSVNLRSDRPSFVSGGKVFVRPISDKNVDTETQNYNKDKQKISQIVASQSADGGSHLALEDKNTDYENPKKEVDISTNNGKPKGPDAISVYGSKDDDGNEASGGASQSNYNRSFPSEPKERTSYNGKSGSLVNKDGILSLKRNNSQYDNSDMTVSTNNGHYKDLDTVSYQLPNSGHSKKSETLSSLPRNNNPAKERDTLSSISPNNGYSKQSNTLSSLSPNNGYSKQSNTLSSLSPNNGHSKQSSTLSSLSRNNDPSKQSAILSSLSQNNGHSKDPDIIPSLLKNNEHSKESSISSSLLQNNDYSKDPDIKPLTPGPTLIPNRSYKLYSQPSSNHRPLHSDPKQSLQDSDNLDAQFGTNPIIVSVPDTPKYNQPMNSKPPVTRNVSHSNVNNDPSSLSNYGATNRSTTYDTRSGKPRTVHTETTATSNKIIPAASQSSKRDSYSKLAVRPPPVYSTPVPLEPADTCRPNKCRLPDCRCGGTNIPGDLPVSEVPQVVLLTFDDAVNALNYDLYQEIFTGRKNPNGCPILGTFYVSHEWTDYSQVQTLYSEGHEMASHTISHSFGEKFSKNRWLKEVHGQREILHLYGGVKMEDVRGMRAPFLQIGGNNMFEMLYEANFTYDSSMPVFDNNPPLWPYTLDYAINHECMITPCPKKSFPGLWEVGMVMWVDLRGGRCSMADACFNAQDEEGITKFFRKNFHRHYNSNRAPLGLFYHSAWFTTPHHKKGFIKFLDEIMNKGDVWLITNWQLIQWIRNPTPKSKLNSFEPWQCKRNERPPPCHNPKVCNVGSKNGVRYMKTCQKCPKNYPWVGKTGYKQGD
ncbi:uncharacterized protein LOC143233508 [Tachypleus tridentatus]|uniref:uncharacterized protein LOC143233508 n=1 Tax=Tachypleus tridentatus TaxID=6853 RepID=UPI003FD2F6F1